MWRASVHTREFSYFLSFYLAFPFHFQQFEIMSSNAEKYTKICPGGGLILAWQLKGKKVLLVGGGNVAAGMCSVEICSLGTH
jgi:hypothetical protein